MGSRFLRIWSAPSPTRVLEAVTGWQNRPLYPLIVFDAIRIKGREEGT
jgi:transposase-like protein